MKRIGLLLFGALVATGGTVWGMTADDLAQKTGIAGGLCSFPRVVEGDEALAFELARRPTLVVHLSSSSAQNVARIRDAAEAKGTLGRSLYVEKGGATLPFADRLVDLLVVSDLRDADLTPELRSAWLRVLAPRRGAAHEDAISFHVRPLGHVAEDLEKQGLQVDLLYGETVAQFVPGAEVAPRLDRHGHEGPVRKRSLEPFLE